MRQVSDEQAMEMTIVENLQRADLNPMEQARAYDRLAREFQLTQEQMAKRTGKDRASVANFLRLLKLPEDVQGQVEEGVLSFGHARALLPLENPQAILKAAQKVAALAMSVRQTERLCSEDPESTGEEERRRRRYGECRSERARGAGVAAAGAGIEGADRGSQGTRAGDHRIWAAGGVRPAAGAIAAVERHSWIGLVRRSVSSRREPHFLSDICLHNGGMHTPRAGFWVHERQVLCPSCHASSAAASISSTVIDVRHFFRCSIQSVRRQFSQSTW